MAQRMVCVCVCFLTFNYFIPCRICKFAHLERNEQSNCYGSFFLMKRKNIAHKS